MTVIGSAHQPVDGLLGRWDPPATAGLYTLRLTAADLAENGSEARVTVNVAPGPYVERLSVIPALFSPNGDGRRDTTTLEYKLRVRGRVVLQVRDTQDVLVRAIEAGVVHDPGLQAFPWDGRNEAGSAAADGEYRLWIRVEDPADVGAPQEQAVAFFLDRTAPEVVVERPAISAFVSRSQTVRGSVTDARLSSYLIEATPEGGVTVELGRGSQSRIGEDLASLALLADGPHTLIISAEDAAENRTQVQIPFVLDSLGPVAQLLTPAAAAVLRKGADPIDVVGTASDAYLQDCVLAFGAGPEPAALRRDRAGQRGRQPPRGWPAGQSPASRRRLHAAADRHRPGTQSAQTRTTVTLDGTPPSLPSPRPPRRLHAK